LQGSFNPLRHTPTFGAVAHLPLAEQARILSQPDERDQEPTVDAGHPGIEWERMRTEVNGVRRSLGTKAVEQGIGGIGIAAGVGKEGGILREFHQFTLV